MINLNYIAALFMPLDDAKETLDIEDEPPGVPAPQIRLNFKPDPPLHYPSSCIYIVEQGK